MVEHTVPMSSRLRLLPRQDRTTEAAPFPLAGPALLQSQKHPLAVVHQTHGVLLAHLTCYEWQEGTGGQKGDDDDRETTQSA